MKAILITLILTLCFMTSNVTAQGFAKIKLEDQFGEPIEINENTTSLIFSHSMDGNNWVRDAMISADMSIEEMQRNGIIYVADIHRMPKFVTKLIAIPRMKDYGFPIALDKTGSITKDWYREENTVTVYQLDQLQIMKVYVFSELDSLEQFMKEL